MKTRSPQPSIVSPIIFSTSLQCTFFTTQSKIPIDANFFSSWVCPASNHRWMASFCCKSVWCSVYASLMSVKGKYLWSKLRDGRVGGCQVYRFLANDSLGCRKICLIWGAQAHKKFPYACRRPRTRFWAINIDMLQPRFARRVRGKSWDDSRVTDSMIGCFVSRGDDFGKKNS